MSDMLEKAKANLVGNAVGGQNPDRALAMVTKANAQATIALAEEQHAANLIAILANPDVLARMGTGAEDHLTEELRSYLG